MNDNWVSVDDELPVINKKYFVSEDVLGFDGEMYYVCWVDSYNEGGIYWKTRNVNGNYLNITHWQPLPNPPKEND